MLTITALIAMIFMLIIAERHNLEERENSISNRLNVSVIYREAISKDHFKIVTK